MALRGGFQNRWTVALVCLAVVVLLLFPMRLPARGHVWQAAGGSLHALLFAGLAWIVGRKLPGRFRSWILWGALAVFSAGVEWIQPYLGRSAELVDWLYGAGGAACICSTWHLRLGAGIRWAAVLALGFFPLAWELAMWGLEINAFPVLAEPGTFWSGRGWTLNSVRVSAASENHLRVAKDRGACKNNAAAYPGVFRAPAQSDWRRMQALQTAVFWPGPGPVLFAIRVDDRSGNPPYADRFQREFTATQGWNFVQIPVGELGRTAGGRHLQLGAICQWGVFLVSAVPFDYFLLRSVRLNLEQENP
jgi:hypothetical protein